jgi:hypothetical protein
MRRRWAFDAGEDTWQFYSGTDRKVNVVGHHDPAAEFVITGFSA